VDTFGTRIPFTHRQIHSVKRRVFGAPKKRARLDVHPKTNFHFGRQLPTTVRPRCSLRFWGLASIAVIAGLVVGEMHPMPALGPSNLNGISTLFKSLGDRQALQIFPSVPQKGNAEPGRVKTIPVVQEPERSPQPPTAAPGALVPLPRVRPKLQIVRYSRYYYVRTVDQGDADGRLAFHIERRVCKSPNLPPVCFESLSVRQKTILDDF
jgi:hypothetical protein